MPNTEPATHNAVRAVDYVASLEHEVAQLRQQLALLSAQASDRLLRTPSGKEELFDSEARYRALIELSPQVVWMTDAQGNPTYTNRYWHELSGFTSKETSGTGWTSALHPEDSEAMFKGWMEAVAQGVPYETEARIRRENDGQYRWHLIRGAPVRNASGPCARRSSLAAIPTGLRFTPIPPGSGCRNAVFFPVLMKYYTGKE